MLHYHKMSDLLEEGKEKNGMLILLEKVPLVPHEFLKLSHKSVQPRSLNLILSHILLPQWTVSEIVILKCKRKGRKDPPQKLRLKADNANSGMSEIYSVGCPECQIREETDLRANTMLCCRTFVHPSLIPICEKVTES